MQRRTLMQQMGLATLGMMIPLSSQAWVSRAATPVSGAYGGRPKRMIVIFLRGAVDGLSVLVPYNEASYYSNRPNIALAEPGQPGGVFDLEGRFGLHPALEKTVLPMWKSGDLSFVVASGSPNGTRSHFDAQDYMESATPGVKNTPDGWMNRLMGVVQGGTPIQALNVGTTTPRILRGPAKIATIAPGKLATQASLLDRDTISNAFDALYKQPNRVGEAYRDAKEVRKALQDNFKQEMQQADNGAASAAGFPADARRMAQFMLRDGRIQVGFMSIGGWDTHAGQGAATGALASNLRLLGEGIKNLKAGLGEVFEDTVILVMSEFGRTVKENGTKGTDHGRGNVMWLAGGGLRGQQIHGNWLGLSPTVLEEGRDVPVMTDFRAVLTPIFRQHWGFGDEQIRAILTGYELPDPAEGLNLFG